MWQPGPKSVWKLKAVRGAARSVPLPACVQRPSTGRRRRRGQAPLGGARGSRGPAAGLARARREGSPPRMEGCLLSLPGVSHRKWLLRSLAFDSLGLLCVTAYPPVFLGPSRPQKAAFSRIDLPADRQQLGQRAAVLSESGNFTSFLQVAGCFSSFKRVYILYRPFPSHKPLPHL